MALPHPEPVEGRQAQDEVFFSSLTLSLSKGEGRRARDEVKQMPDNSLRRLAASFVGLVISVLEISCKVSAARRLRRMKDA